MTSIVQREMMIVPPNEDRKTKIAIREAEIKNLPGFKETEHTEVLWGETQCVIFKTKFDSGYASHFVDEKSPSLPPHPKKYISDCLEKWEPGWECDPTDREQYVQDQDGTGRLVGKCFGVTPLQLARHLRIDASWIDEAVMRAAFGQADNAADVYYRSLFQEHGFDKLMWCPLVAIAVDAAMMSGPGRATKMLQELIGTAADGSIGPQTVEALSLYVESHDIMEACSRLALIRQQFYIGISGDGTKNARFRAKWLARARWASPFGNTENFGGSTGLRGVIGGIGRAVPAAPSEDSASDWWTQWKDWRMPYPAASASATGLLPRVAKLPRVSKDASGSEDQSIENERPSMSAMLKAARSIAPEMRMVAPNDPKP